MKYVLGADIGSGSVKLTLLTSEGKIAAASDCEYPTYYTRVGWSEQEPEDWCRAFGTALSELLRKAGAESGQIAALSVDAATHTAVLLDKERKPLRRAILWTDQRSTQEVAWLNENCLELIRAQTMNSPTTVWTLPQLMWLKKHEPHIWEKTDLILFAKDYLRFRLTGTLETDHIDAMGSMLYDVHKQKWSKELCAAGEINPSWLPELRRSDDFAGYVTKAAAEEFGLSEKTKVFVGTTDTVMEVFAVGSVAEGHATVKLATAGRICVITDHPLDSEYIFNYRHVVPRLWYPGTATASCAASYRWFRDTLGREPYEKLNDGAAAISAGSEGLMFHPYLNGELTPYNDPALRGSYTGISSRHTSAHFTRATLEGVAMSLKDCLRTFDELGVGMKRVRIIGGGAKGSLWRQIVSDVLGMELEKVKVDDSSFGTAMLAAVCVGWYSDFAEAAERCVEIESVSNPIKENLTVYEELFERYKAIHDALAPIYTDKQDKER